MTDFQLIGTLFLFIFFAFLIIYEDYKSERDIEREPERFSNDKKTKAESEDLHNAMPKHNNFKESDIKSS